MKKKRTFYGVKFPKDSLMEEAEMCQLARLLLLSPTTSVEEAGRIINSNKLNHVIPELIKSLKLELVDVAKTDYVSVDENDEDSLSLNMFNKIFEWKEKFGMPTEQELSELGKAMGLQKHFRWKKLIRNVNAQKYNTPPRILKRLQQSIIGQTEALKSVAVKMVEHQLRINSETPLPQSTCLLIGETGTGKSFTVKMAADLLAVPTIRINCGDIVPVGIVGKNIPDHLTLLYQKCNKHIDEMNKAIIHFDELDKISSYYHNSDEKFKANIQHELLRFFDNDEQLYFPETPKQYTNHIALNTSGLMLIFSGAFSGIDNIVYKRLLLENDGKTQLIDMDNLLYYCSCDDIQEYGIYPELAGRLSCIVPMRNLTESDMYGILRYARNSEMEKHKNKFRQLGIHLRIGNDALSYIAAKASRLNTGARSLQTVLESIFSEYYFEAHKYKGKEIVISAATLSRTVLKKQQPVLYKAFEQKKDIMQLSQTLNIDIDTILDYYKEYINTK